MNTIPEKTLIKLLPSSLQLMMQEGITLGCIMQLIKSYGGTDLYIPNTVNESSKLVKLLGIKQAQLLVKKYKGDNFYVPKAIGIKSYLRDIKINKDYSAGLKIKDIAMKNDISIRTLQIIIKRHRQIK